LTLSENGRSLKLDTDGKEIRTCHNANPYRTRRSFTRYRRGVRIPVVRLETGLPFFAGTMPPSKVGVLPGSSRGLRSQSAGTLISWRCTFGATPKTALACFSFSSMASMRYTIYSLDGLRRMSQPSRRHSPCEKPPMSWTLITRIFSHRCTDFVQRRLTRKLLKG